MNSAQHLRGKFITLEGLEGVGKTTNREFVEQWLTRSGIEFIGTREPGGTPLGEKLRSLVLHTDDVIQAETELLLMAASRIEHVAQVIEPALQNGQWVLCDRFLDASIAYQGGGRLLGVGRVAEVHRLMGLSLRPDLTLLLDMPIEQGLARAAERGKPDRIEKEKLDFFERARAAYRQLAVDEPDRISLIDASLSLVDVQLQIQKAVQALIADVRSC